ncbi:hypothetical protein C5167_022247 [Papaver somniferum]|uniref:Uncharacterized protein n=1 Tax=Papaver somniferum TaxID=3469 RepID=A0A4Y7JKA2_PAPSO|nr:hypothetical protein C5167_022247 [Papaver somniferum]
MDHQSSCFLHESYKSRFSFSDPSPILLSSTHIIVILFNFFNLVLHSSRIVSHRKIL